MLCSECGKEFDSEETIFEVISVPNNDFKSHVLAKFCEKCFHEVRKDFIKKIGHDFIEC